MGGGGAVGEQGALFRLPDTRPLAFIRGQSRSPTGVTRVAGGYSQSRLPDAGVTGGLREVIPAWIF